MEKTFFTYYRLNIEEKKKMIKIASGELSHDQNDDIPAEDKPTVAGQVKVCLEYILERMNENGAKIAFQIPDTKNYALLSCKADRGDEWIFMVSAFRAGTDMLISYFLSSGNRAEVIAYMNDEQARKEIADSVIALSKKVDSKY